MFGIPFFSNFGDIIYAIIVFNLLKGLYIHDKHFLFGFVLITVIFIYFIFLILNIKLLKNIAKNRDLSNEQISDFFLLTIGCANFTSYVILSLTDINNDISTKKKQKKEDKKVENEIVVSLEKKQ